MDSEEGITCILTLRGGLVLLEVRLWDGMGWDGMGWDGLDQVGYNLNLGVGSTG